MKLSGTLLVLSTLALAACSGGAGTVPSTKVTSVAPASHIRLPFTAIRATQTAGTFEFVDGNGAVVGTATNAAAGATFQLNGRAARHYTYDRTMSSSRNTLVSYTPYGTAVRLQRSPDGISFTAYDRNPKSAKSFTVPVKQSTQAQSTRRKSCNGQVIDMFLASMANFALQDFVDLTGITTTTASDPNAVAVVWQPNIGGPAGDFYFPPETIYVDPVSADLLLGDIANNNAQVWGQITDDLAQFMSYGSLLADDLSNPQCVAFAG